MVSMVREHRRLVIGALAAAVLAAVVAALALTPSGDDGAQTGDASVHRLSAGVVHTCALSESGAVEWLGVE